MFHYMMSKHLYIMVDLHYMLIQPHYIMYVSHYIILWAIVFICIKSIISFYAQTSLFAQTAFHDVTTTLYISYYMMWTILREEELH